MNTYVDTYIRRYTHTRTHITLGTIFSTNNLQMKKKCSRITVAHTRSTPSISGK